MPLFAEIVGGVVQRVIVVEPLTDDQGRELLTAQEHCDRLVPLRDGDRWVQQKDGARHPSAGDTLHDAHPLQFSRPRSAVGEGKEFDPDTLEWKRAQAPDPGGQGR